jgi:hypothetical protein
MREFITNCGKMLGQPEIGFCAEEMISEYAIDLVKYFETEIKYGHVFRAEETVQIGWMILKLTESKHGNLDLMEPQFDSIPIRWIRGLNNTLRHLMLHKSVCALFSLEPTFPTIRQAGIVSPGFISGGNDITMTRGEIAENDSGWMFTESGYIQNDGDLKSLYEISFFHSKIIPFLALPMGTTVRLNSADLQINLGGKTLSSESNEFLKKLLDTSVFV